MKRLLTMVLVMAACGGSTPTAELVTPASTACDADFAVAAAVDDMQDSVRDLYPAVRDCKSLEEWSAAFIAHDGAGFIGDPIEFLRNACRGPEITDEPLCKSVPSAIDVPPDVAAIADEACADTTYTGCVEGVRTMIAESSADLIVICEYGDGLGDVIIIASEDQAAEECAFGSHPTSRVVKVLPIPRDP